VKNIHFCAPWKCVFIIHPLVSSPLCYSLIMGLDPHLYSLANLLDLSCLAFESTFRFGTLTTFLASRARQASCWRCDQSYVPRQPCHSEELLPVHEPLISPVDRACVHLTLVPLLQVTTLNLSGEASASRFIFQSCHFPKGVLKKCG
jgi:hypothetical protein